MFLGEHIDNHKKKMSIQFLNSNSNSIINNNEIEMKEPNAEENKINAVFGMERRLFKFELDPNILTTNLLQYFQNNNLPCTRYLFPYTTFSKATKN